MANGQEERKDGQFQGFGQGPGQGASGLPDDEDDPRPYLVVPNGKQVLATQAEVDHLRATSSAHLLVDVPDRRVRVRRASDGVVTWERIPPLEIKVLYTGMERPGAAYGHRTIRSPYSAGVEEIPLISLQSATSRLRRLVKRFGDGVDYFRSEFVGGEHSRTGWGYAMELEWRYVIILRRNWQRYASDRQMTG